MSFKLNDLDKYLTEDFIEDDEELNLAGDESIAKEMGKFADVPETEVGDEEDTIPPEEADVVGGFEMNPENNGYLVTHDGSPVCFVKIMCKGHPVDMETVENPSECTAMFSDIVDSEKATEYQKKIEGMGMSTVVKPIQKESKNHLLDKSNQLLEE